MFERPFTFDRVIRIGISVLLVGLVLYLLVVLRDALLPFLIAWLMAYMCQPFVRFFQYTLRLKSRILSIVAVLLSGVLLVFLLTVMVIPSITEESQRLLALLNNQNPIQEHIPFIPQSWLEYIEHHIDLQALREMVSRENFLDTLKQIAPKAWKLLTGTFSVLFSLAIVFVIFLYFI